MMMKISAVAVLFASLTSTGRSVRLRAPMRNEDGEVVIQASIGDVDGLPNEDTESVMETKKPKYVEFFDGEDADEDQKDEGKTYVPEYKKASHEGRGEKPTVTKGFCAQILTDIKEKNAPYYVDGEFTGEMRQDLIEQCGSTICDWGVEYRNLVDDCGACPESCDGDFDPRSFFQQLLEDDGSSSSIIEAILHISKGEGGSKEVRITLKAGDEEEEDEGATGAMEEYDPEDYPLPAKENGDDDEGGVTKAFCIKVLKDVRAKKAPYYVDDQFTGEARESLKDQCGDMICGWSSSFADLMSGDGSCSNENKEEYLEGLLEDDVATDEIATFAEADEE